MTGLFKFDFYIKDWIDGTRNLSNSAKGAYINIISAMYGRGGPFPYNETDLCRLTGCATVRSLRPLIHELIKNGKLKIVDGHLVNDRVQLEIPKIENRIARSSKGGQARSGRVQAEFDGNSTGTQAETRHESKENQHSSMCKSTDGDGDRREGCYYYSKNKGNLDQENGDWVDPEPSNVYPFGKGAA